MKVSFFIEELAFYEIESHAAESIINFFNLISCPDKIPNFNWQNELRTLPSPIRANDCFGVWASRVAPSQAMSFVNTIIDIIRLEKRPKASGLSI